jgi:NhaP-type Na+/H+ or K+/H+ antiporter
MRLDDSSAFVICGAIVALVYLSRHVIAGALCDRDMSRKHVALTALMVPKGLAAAVLASMPQQYGVPGGEKIQAIAYAVVLLSIALTALLIASRRVDFVKAVYARLYRGAN